MVDFLRLLAFHVEGEIFALGAEVAREAALDPEMSRDVVEAEVRWYREDLATGMAVAGLVHSGGLLRWANDPGPRHLAYQGDPLHAVVALLVGVVREIAADAYNSAVEAHHEGYSDDEAAECERDTIRFFEVMMRHTGVIGSAMGPAALVGEFHMTEIMALLDA